MRKLMGIFLSMTLAVSMLAGCGGTGASGTSGQQGAAQETEAAEPAAEPAAELKKLRQNPQLKRMQLSPQQRLSPRRNPQLIL